MNFEKHTFFITGASSGLGLAIAKEALDNGHAVIGTARNTKTATEKHPEFTANGGKWEVLDITDADVEHRVGNIIEEHDVSVLVNNAGYGLYGALEDMRFARLSHLTDINIY
jgi:short-subunit dehydrogenase